MSNAEYSGKTQSLNLAWSILLFLGGVYFVAKYLAGWDRVDHVPGILIWTWLGGSNFVYLKQLLLGRESDDD